VDSTTPAHLFLVDDDRDNLEILTVILSEKHRVSSYSSGAEALRALDAVRPDLVCLYALRALPAHQAAGVGAHISVCAECRQELETLRPIVDAFVAWPTDVLRPSPSLWDRLAQRIGAETGGEPVRPSSEREPEWKEGSPGHLHQAVGDRSGARPREHAGASGASN